MIGINPDYDWMFDPQQARPVGYCPVCGREIYGGGRDICGRCEEETMSQYRECEICGAALDPGERCDCDRSESEDVAEDG